MGSFMKRHSSIPALPIQFDEWAHVQGASNIFTCFHFVCTIEAMYTMGLRMSYTCMTKLYFLWFVCIVYDFWSWKVCLLRGFNKGLHTHVASITLFNCMVVFHLIYSIWHGPPPSHLHEKKFKKRRKKLTSVWIMNNIGVDSTNIVNSVNIFDINVAMNNTGMNSDSYE
jgi:hypothetical protein